MRTTVGLLVAGALAVAAATGCSEKADEAAMPMGSGNGERGNSAAGPRTIEGIPETGHFAPSDFAAGDIEGSLNQGACSVENVVAAVDEAPAVGDAPNRYRVLRDRAYRLVGFVVDKEAGTVPAAAQLVLAGGQTYAVPLPTGRPRGDVADYFDNPAFAESGFMQDVAFARVSPGEYALYVFDAASGRFCTTSQSVSVTD